MDEQSRSPGGVERDARPSPDAATDSQTHRLQTEMGET
jgi:hypothetical protein